MGMDSGFVKTVSAIAVLALVGACEQASNQASSSVAATECVQIDEGNYLFQDGKFVKANMPLAKTNLPVAKEANSEPVKQVDAGPVWYKAIETGLIDQGFDWIGLSVRGNSATLLGLAPDEATKTAAFETGKAAILGAPEGAGMNVIDGISVEGGEIGVGAALAELDDAPTLASCQKVFGETMQNRNVQFRIGSATVLPSSARLLDALAGVAEICSAYNVEIGGHTDRIGDDGLNLKLSQQRADSVRAYLQARDVDVSNVTAVGYGETRPVDNTGTRAGDALNRRTEFKVLPR